RGKVNFNSGDEIGGTGVFDQGEVSKVIKGRMSALKRCYETSLKSNPTLAGKVVVEFTIEERGNVSKARAADNSTGDAGFAGCIVDTIKRLRWKKGPDGGSVTFQYPFVFAPQN
ncbi:MAG: TonB family protein, partial [Myxococcales bacterium]|nr:TonB family protein [Myxococcales bacterium]